MPFGDSWKNKQVCRSSAMAISVMGFVNVGSGRESVEAILSGPRGGASNDVRAIRRIM